MQSEEGLYRTENRAALPLVTLADNLCYELILDKFSLTSINLSRLQMCRGFLASSDSQLRRAAAGCQGRLTFGWTSCRRMFAAKNTTPAGPAPRRTTVPWP